MDHSKERTLLIDGDTIAYIAAAAAQQTVEQEDGFIEPFANVAEGEAVVDNLVLGLMRDLEAHGMQVYLSDPESNWRKELMPEYKANRKPLVRPLLLARMKDYLRTKYGASHWAALEADDVLGILATSPEPLFPGQVVVVGKDKDFNTIPGFHHQIKVDAPGAIREVTHEQAAFAHYVQALAGDRVDGYFGCPGVGPDRARQYLAEPFVLSPEHGIITRGERKGQATIKWVKVPAPGDYWGAVVSQYEKAGLGIEVALLNARMAHILQWPDYDRDTGAVTLWVPPHMRQER